MTCLDHLHFARLRFEMLYPKVFLKCGEALTEASTPTVLHLENLPIPRQICISSRGLIIAAVGIIIECRTMAELEVPTVFAPGLAVDMQHERSPPNRPNDIAIKLQQ